MDSATTAGGHRVLVVEDDASLRRLLEMRLGGDGHAVRVAPDGGAALSVLREWRPDVVVSDVMMPRMSGFSLCRAIRAEEGLCDLPIILLTARPFDAEVQAVLDLGGISFMNKPFDASALLAAVDDSVRGRVTTSIDA